MGSKYLRSLQVAPMKPVAHVQAALPELSAQVPPFVQGLGVQGSAGTQYTNLKIQFVGIKINPIDKNPFNLKDIMSKEKYILIFEFEIQTKLRVFFIPISQLSFFNYMTWIFHKSPIVAMPRYIFIDFRNRSNNRGPRYQHGLTFIPVSICNYIHFEVWDEIT